MGAGHKSSRVPCQELGEPCQEPLPGLRDPGVLQGVQAKRAGGKVVGGWLAQQMDHPCGHGVLDESGLGAGEEGSGLKSHMNGQELDGGARV